MKFSFEKRLRDVEQTKGAREATLTFPNGSTRAIRVRNQSQLRLLFDAFAKMRAYPPPAPEGFATTPPAEPHTANDTALELLGRAQKCEGPRFLQLVHALAQGIEEGRQQKKREAGGENARTVRSGN
jgi:hypothetical protein